MSLRKTLIGIAIGWLVFITVLHAAINLHLFDSKRATAADQNKFRIGFLPVTCHLICPVTDFINKQITGTSVFQPLRFNGWPELKEAYLSGYTPATFILAPMAIALREQGVPIKIVYLGHRDGSAVMVRKDSNIFRMEEWRRDSRARGCERGSSAWGIRLCRWSERLRKIEFAQHSCRIPPLHFGRSAR